MPQEPVRSVPDPHHAGPTGWGPDPLGRHEYRYLVSGRPTDLVSDQGRQSVDPLGSGAPPESAPSPVAGGGGAPPVPNLTYGPLGAEADALPDAAGDFTPRVPPLPGGSSVAGPPPVPPFASGPAGAGGAPGPRRAAPRPSWWRSLPIPERARVPVVVGAVVVVVLLLVAVAGLSGTSKPAGQAVAAAPDPGAASTTAAPRTTTAPPSTAPPTTLPTATLALAEPVFAVEDAESVWVHGTASPGATVVLQMGSVRQEAVADDNGAFAFEVGPLPEGDSTAVLIAGAGDSRWQTTTVEARLRRSVSPEGFKASTSPIVYDDLKKDPDARVGEAVRARAQVMQYDSRTGTGAMLVNVTPISSSYWTDLVLVRLDPGLGDGIDEDDIVEFWGTVEGAYSYDTAIGGSNTVPEVRARYLELVEKG